MATNVKVAVLGANGQIGSVLIRHLSRVSQLHVVAICRNALGAGLLSALNCEVRQGSITADRWDPKLVADCPSVVNCVWPQGSAKAVNSQNKALLRNVRRSDVLRKFVSLGSVAVYGNCIDASWSTFDSPKPDIVYGQGKFAMEKATAGCFADTAVRYYLLRLGHVYGNEQWLSRLIVDCLLDKQFRLPFDGKLLSNAIHVDEVAQALVHLLLEDYSSGVMNLASTPQRTWRQIFDWHSQVCGLPHAESMEHNRSEQHRNSFVALSKKGPLRKASDHMFSWLRSMSPLGMLSSPDVRAAGSKLLDVLPARWERRAKALSAIWTVRRQIDAFNREPSVAAMFCCDAMPGQYLEIPPISRTFPADPERELRDWYQQAVVGPMG